ncbi:MAG: tetratricopeptide repeat protein [Proteobacteria bacterium]|nr:tetratricopeptide repeat protein [Pseudomonadota bacterium]
MSKVDDAIGVCRRSAEMRPETADDHDALGTALKELGKLDEALAAYRRALEIEPGHAGAHNNLGHVLQKLGRFEAAAAAHRRAIAIRPRFAKAHSFLGLALSALGRPGAAIEAHRRAAAIKPDYARAHYNLGKLLLEQGDPAAAVRVCDAYLEAHPGHIRVLAFKAVALDEMGERDSARTLVDFDRFIRATRPAAPAGFRGMADFNAALAGHVRRHPTLVYAPTSRATRSGKHTAELLGRPKGPAAALEGMIRSAVEDYMESLPAQSSHPFIATRPKRWGLTAWAVVLGTQGYQTAHIHPDGWLSGVYYVKIPAAIGTPGGPPGGVPPTTYAGGAPATPGGPPGGVPPTTYAGGAPATPGQGQAGWIEFGRPRAHYHCTREPEVEAFRPEEGLMMVFPSYFYHRTIPFEAAEQRISIAFDVLPEA